ncbi:MAG: hypothetical protein LDLANPLL_02169 [Turneriella sp.]|nr:hypothetical protein [Turneriella sp.]
MEILGRHLTLPHNFLFLHRLPARFEVIVVGRGATFANGTAFELEILGQRLVLRSKIELKLGARYELEKVDSLNFRILTEKTDEKNTLRESDESLPQARKENEQLVSLDYFQNFPEATIFDLFALKILEESAQKIKEQGSKFLFEFTDKIGMKGIFVPLGTGEYSLFITGKFGNTQIAKELVELLFPLRIRKVQIVSTQVFEQIASGAVNISI